MRRLLTAEEVAELLSVDRSTVYDWARAGTIPSYRMGRVVRFDPEQLEHWLGGHLVGTPARQTPRTPARSINVAVP